MAVLIQEGVNADSAGVMITTAPTTTTTGRHLYQRQTRPGDQWWKGKRVAEQLIFRPRSNSSGPDTLGRGQPADLRRERRRSGSPDHGERAVLTDQGGCAVLARTATLIKGVFGGKEQDIEWVFMGDQIYIVQSRPYIKGS